MEQVRFDKDKTFEFKVAMLRKGVKQADIARLSGVTEAYVSQVVNGKAPIPPLVVKAIRMLMPEFDLGGGNVEKD